MGLSNDALPVTKRDSLVGGPSRRAGAIESRFAAERLLHGSGFMTEERKRATRKIDEVEARLAKSPIGKALLDGGLSLIPALGPAVSSAVATRASNLAARNTAALVVELRAGVERLAAEKIDAAFLESDEFTSLLIRTLQLNAFTYRAEKAHLFAQVFLGFLLPPGRDLSFKDAFLRLVDELEPEHIAVLRIIHRESAPDRPGRAAGRASVELIAPELGLPEGRVLAYGVQMMRCGLVQDDSIGRLGYTPGRWVITSYGSEFCRHLESPLP